MFEGVEPLLLVSARRLLLFLHFTLVFPWFNWHSGNVTLTLQLWILFVPTLCTKLWHYEMSSISMSDEVLIPAFSRICTKQLSSQAYQMICQKFSDGQITMQRMEVINLNDRDTQNISFHNLAPSPALLRLWTLWSVFTALIDQARISHTQGSVTRGASSQGFASLRRKNWNVGIRIYLCVQWPFQLFVKESEKLRVLYAVRVFIWIFVLSLFPGDVRNSLISSIGNFLARCKHSNRHKWSEQLF